MTSDPHSVPRKANPSDPYRARRATPLVKGNNEMTRRAGPELSSAQAFEESTVASAELRTLGQSHVMGASTADVGSTRERVRQRRLFRLGLILLPIALLLVARAVFWGGGAFAVPH